MNRNKTIDIIKGIAILSIIIGHSSWTIGNGFNIGPFVYSYHIMAFMFVAGFCYNAEKYANRFREFVGSKLLSVIPLYFVYNLAFVILHNVLLHYHMIDGEPYTLVSMISFIAMGLCITTNENLIGPFWFLGMYLVAQIVFGFIMEMSSRMKAKYAKHIFTAVATVALGAVGLYITCNQVMLPYHVQTSLLAIPFMMIGYLVKLYWDYLRRWFNVIGCVVSAILLYILIQQGLAGSDLSANIIYNYKLYYLTTLIGIYFCISFARTIEKIPALNSIMTYAGQKSFHLMALHMTAFKIVDGIYGRMRGLAPETYGIFPHSYDIWWVYYLVGFGGVLGVIYLVDCIKRIIAKKVRVENVEN
ncbi:MAG: acyltransferase family protein [Lachnospiraceae bacterium]|nr:acyltransferase family protein [Lachnospiraceae bacterium]